MPAMHHVLILMGEERFAYISQNIGRLWPRESSAFLTGELDEHGAVFTLRFLSVPLRWSSTWDTCETSFLWR